MYDIELLKGKSIGHVVYVVEGGVTEFTLLEQIFSKILDYTLLIVKKGSRIIQKYVSKTDRNSTICIVQSQSSNIASIYNQLDYLDSVYESLSFECDVDVENSSVYFLFDRDPLSNNNPGLIKELINSLGNSRDNGNEMNGMLLLSYPCIESYVVSCFEERRNLPHSQSHDIKTYIGKQSYQQNQIGEKELVNAAKRMCEIVEPIIGQDEVTAILDNFSDTNLRIFGEEEKYRYQNGYHFLLSLLAISFLDLGILQIV